MKARFVVAIFLVSWIPNATVAGDAADALALIPSEAVGFVCVPNAATLDTDITTTINTLGFAGFVPIPNSSVLELVQMRVPQLKQMQTDKPFIIAVMPTDDLEDMQSSQVVMIPTEDTKAFIKELDGNQKDDDLWSVEFAGQELTAAESATHVLLAEKPAYLNDVVNSKATMSKSLIKPIVASLDKLDIVVGINVEKLSTIAGPMIQEQFADIMEIQATTDLEKKSVALQKKQIKRLLDGLGAVIVGLRIEDNGIVLHMAGSVRDGSELAESTHMPVTADSLLKGLPQEDWAMAIGQLADEEQMRNQAKSLDEMFEVYQAAEDIDKDKLAELQEKIKSLSLMHRGYRAAAVPIASGDGDPDAGVIGVHLIGDFEDSDKALVLTKEIFELGQELASDLDEEFATVFEAVEFEADGDVSVLNVDLEEIEDLDEDTLDMIEAVVGSELAIRMMKLDDTKILMSFGGGPDRLQKLSKDSNDPAVSNGNHAGLEPLSEFLPDKRNSVTYLFVDQTIELARNVLIALDEDDLPFPTPEVTTPIAISAAGGENWWSVDVVVPMEVIEAGRDIAMLMLGRGQ